MMSSMDFLLWVRGPLFDIALTIFAIGVVMRLMEILLLGRKINLAAPRGSEVGPGFKTVFRRSIPAPGMMKKAPFRVVVGYVWHIGFLICLLLFIPHIEFFKEAFGISWPGLPNPLVDAVAAVTIVSLIAVLVYRLRNPVMRLLSDYDDYLSWVLTFLPLLTGYLAYHRLIDPYPLIMGIHILTVEIFMILFPFTKLMHLFTAFLSRWYNGAMAGRKGVES